MNSRSRNGSPGERWTDDDFELAAALKDATAAPEAPPSLFRRVPWQRSLATLASALVVSAAGAWAVMAALMPPQLVREAMQHEHREATLRGDFQRDKQPMLQALGLHDGASLPGLLQLQRPCDIGGRVAYHLTTFIEKGGGMVTILAFEQPLADAPAGAQGRWMGRHWRFVEGVPGKTILLLADNPHVLPITEGLLRKS